MLHFVISRCLVAPETQAPQLLLASFVLTVLMLGHKGNEPLDFVYMLCMVRCSHMIGCLKEQVFCIDKQRYLKVPIVSITHEFASSQPFSGSTR